MLYIRQHQPGLRGRNTAEVYIFSWRHDIKWEVIDLNLGLERPQYFVR